MGHADAEIKISFGESPELSKFFGSFKPEVRQNIALHALPSARDSAFLISAFQVHSTSFFQSFVNMKRGVSRRVNQTCEMFYNSFNE